MTWAALLLAVAVLVGTGPTRSAAPTRGQVHPVIDPLAAASCLDVLAACLKAGMAVPAAVSAAAALAPADLAEKLLRAAQLLALGAHPAKAWAQVQACPDPHSAALARMAKRSAESGAAFAQGAGELAEQVREDALASAEAAAGRASVLIAGPLGLCFLPAFICLGIVPVVVGLADRVLGTGLL